MGLAAYLARHRETGSATAMALRCRLRPGREDPGRRDPAEEGGLGRTVVQPGQVQAFNRAQLYAKVSGYLVRQKVDIGDPVKKGQVLAEVDAPELFKARDQARAAVDQARGKIKQMESCVADRPGRSRVGRRRGRAGQGGITNSPRTASTARRSATDRLSGPAEVRRAAAARRAAEAARRRRVRGGRGEGGVVTAAGRPSSPRPSRGSPRPRPTSRPPGPTSRPRPPRPSAQVLVDYTRIISPYDGVVTLRSFHDGDFIRSAAEGGQSPSSRSPRPT